MEPRLVRESVRKWGKSRFHIFECGYCGKEFEASQYRAARTKRMSCGCTRPPSGMIAKSDREWLPHMPGDVVEHGHRVIALKTSGFGAGVKNLYACAHCGSEFEETKGNIRRTRKSCGCIPKPGGKTHGGSGSRLYTIWQGMRDRCIPGKHTSKNHGDRGIRVCEEWQKYEPFRDWALANGYSDTLTIDRIDVNGNYEPSNCRWATRAQQAQNTRKNVINDQIAAVIRRLWQANMDAVEIGALFGFPKKSRAYIRRVGMGYSWTENPVKSPRGKRKDPVDPLSYLTGIRT